MVNVAKVNQIYIFWIDEQKVNFVKHQNIYIICFLFFSNIKKYVCVCVYVYLDCIGSCQLIGLDSNLLYVYTFSCHKGKCAKMLLKRRLFNMYMTNEVIICNNNIETTSSSSLLCL